MGNLVSICAPKALPIETTFNLPSPLPSWPQTDNGGFASGSINLGGLEVYQVSTFTKVWAILEGGPENLGATFFEPSFTPDGYFMLGCYSQPNNQPLYGWVLVGKDDGSHTEPTWDGALTMPTDYTLVWSSENSKLKQDGNGYIWLPVPPPGYRAVGHNVTNSPEKPPLEKIQCVRSDVTQSCQRATIIWEKGYVYMLLWGLHEVDLMA
ncbi:Vacuolar protein sorting-associated protein 62 [Macleaya cordata]|uniref:Vacuolar protein sorting-associated protein 62 n=1 Tax=Macleaya cordata TaxID=56857 RepID=A0A200Q7G6_MACCD|nr:Vacuolar protein sorting-associated protein 62 [Macleaya cordata]